MRTLIASLAALLCFGPASAAVLTVDCEGGGDFLAVQAAVDAAGIGDTLLISACAYEECVDASGKMLTFVGAGAGLTLIECPSGGLALRALEETFGETHLRDISLANVSSGHAVRWTSRLRLDSCEVSGTLDGAGGLSVNDHVSLVANGCSLDDVRLIGGGTSHLSECSLGDLRIVGHFEYENTGPQHLNTSLCSGGAVEVGAVGHLDSMGDEFQSVLLSGGMHAWPSLVADDSSLGPLTIDDECDMVILSGCHLGEVTYVEGPFGYGESRFQFISCTVNGSIDLDCNGLAGMFVHNTVLGDFRCTADYVWFPHRFRSNIVTGEASFAAGSLVATHNDCVGGLTLGASGDSVFANISAEPLFCNISNGDLTLQECSPCVGAAHDEGEIGAHGIGCSCSVPVTSVTWGAVKAQYR
jgi:coenzyme F420-reducing hydrogenase delta subunit